MLKLRQGIRTERAQREPFRCNMKTRLVWCMHIAAFVLSVLVLAVSASSYFRYVKMEWPSDAGYFSAAAAGGNLWLSVNYDLPTAERLTFSLVKPSTIWFPNSLDGQTRYDESHLFGMTSFVVEEQYCINFSMCLIRCPIYMIPLHLLIIPPLIWMCGFHLFQLHRRFRTGRADSPTPQSVHAVPSDR